MIKIIYCITRKQGMSVEEFQRYWWETHRSIAARIPGVRRYVQCHTLPQLYEGDSPPPYDGVAELWFDGLEAFQGILTSPELQTAREDERNFIDHSRSILIITEEKTVVE